MNDEQVLNYVVAAATLAGIPMDAARAGRVAGHLGRTATMAALLEEAGLRMDDEPAEVYCPAPFPGGLLGSVATDGGPARVAGREVPAAAAAGLHLAPPDVIGRP